MRKSVVSLIFSNGFLSKTAVVLFLITLPVAICLKWETLTTTYDNLHTPGPGLFLLDITRLLLIINLAIFIWRTILAVRYRPAPPASDQSLPTCTVIIPAYNEGRQVLDTIISVVRSDYPASKLQIIAVDDGSRDDTWQWILSAADQFPNRIETVYLKKNSGKRMALYQGFIRSIGDILVTIDSDSIIEAHTLRHLVSPFVHDPKTGAVAGNVRVLNTSQGLIPKMLDVSFAFSFDFIRASQSMVDTVFCTPGALSAYKTKAIMNNLETWLNQRFLGRQATIGEDRAMTNLIIRDGWKVKFQSDAIVYTNVPTSYRKLCNMFLRWARSNIRETLIMGSFIFTAFRRAKTAGARVNFLTACVNLLAPRVLIGGFLVGTACDTDAYLLQTLSGSSIWACAPAAFYALRRKTSDALYAFAYSVFWLFGLCWIIPYALLTPANGKWLTRELDTRCQNVSRSLKRPSPIAV